MLWVGIRFGKRAANHMRNCRFGCIVSAAAIAVVCGRSPTARAQVAAVVDVSVDATSAGTPLERVWAFHGYDEINYTTVAEGKALLQTLGSIHTVIPHVRTHFYLNSGDGTPSMKWGSTNAYTLGATGMPVYDWTLMDGITDALIGAGTRPFVEIGFMPHDLSIHPDPYMNSSVTALDGGCFYPPKDYAQWGALISTWATHTSTRYPDAATAWQWELWNEPELNYWHGTPAEYDKLFDYTEAALHQVMPQASLGGPASYNPTSPFLNQFLQHCATGTNAVSGKTGARLDMISFHAKGGTALVGGHVEMNMGNQLMLHRTGFATVASFAQFKKTPIVVTEGDPDGCAACQTAADTYRRVPAYGAYEVEMMKRSLDLEAQLGVNVRGVLAWAFLFPNQAYFADFRVLSSNGIALPVLNAFKLLGSLDGTRLPVTSSGALGLDAIVASGVRGQPDVDAIATAKGDRVQVLVWNYHDDIVAAAASPVHLAVTLPPSFGTKATASHLRMDDAHGNPYAVWLTQGSPGMPTAAQLAQLQQAADDLTLQPVQEVDVIGGVATLDFSLPRFGVSLVTLSPGGAGGGDASIEASGATDAAGDGAAASLSGDGSSPLPSGEGGTPAGSGASGSGGGSGTSGSGGSGASGSGASGRGGSGSGASGDAAPNPGSGEGRSAATPAGAGCSCRATGFARSDPASASAIFALIGLPLAAIARRKRPS
jgi:xylan 1,4-beta-xylosidase